MCASSFLKLALLLQRKKTYALPSLQVFTVSCRAKMIPWKFFFLAMRLELSLRYSINGEATNEEIKVGPKKPTGLQKSSKNLVL